MVEGERGAGTSFVLLKARALYMIRRYVVGVLNEVEPDDRTMDVCFTDRKKQEEELRVCLVVFPALKKFGNSKRS